MNKKIFLAAILFGVLTAGIVIFIYEGYRSEKEDRSAEQKVAILNRKVISLGSALKPGVYKIEGYYSALSVQPDYLGEVIITKNGPVYILEWHWQDGPALRGIGILEGDILSVGFADVTGRAIVDIGVFSYRVIEEDKIEGRWSTFSAAAFGLRETGREILTWQSEPSEAASISRPFSEYLFPEIFPKEGVCGPYPDEVVTGSLTGGPVWGSHPYTDDSDFNRAAVHLGLISPGQTVTIKKTSVGYLYDFPGSTQNGISTFSWTTGWCGVEISLEE